METPSQSAKRRRRSLLFWFFLILAIPLSVLIVAYAAGYRLDTTTGQLVVSSALAIESTPKRATVQLNGVIQETETPFIDTLPAGSYRIELSLPGHLAWSKQITLEAGRSAIFPDVLLFADQPAEGVEAIPEGAQRSTDPLPLQPEQRDQYARLGLSELADWLIVPGPTDLLVNPGGNFSLLAVGGRDQWLSIAGAVTAADWGPDQQLVYGVGSEIWLWSASTEDHLLINRESQRIRDLVWHPDGGYLLYSNDAGVWAIELDGRDRRQTWQLHDRGSDDLRIANNGKLLYFVVDGQTLVRRLID
jgi:hypothetical protein